MSLSVASRRQFFQRIGAAAVLARGGVLEMPVLAAPRSKTLQATEPARLNSNESAYGPFPSAVRAMAKAVERGNYYVWAEAEPIEKRLAEMHGVTVKNLVMGTGSTEPLRAATNVFCSAQHPPVVGDPTFEDVAETAEAHGIQAVKVPVTNRGLLDIERMAEAARERSAGVLYLCNPNNPTGTITGKDKLAWLMENLPSNTVVLSDEAYSDFVDDPSYPSGLPYVKQDRNVIVLKTFSKIYGLAGMRMGYAIGPERLMDKVRALMMGELNSLNQAVVAAGKASLEDRAAYDRVRTENARVRKFTVDGIRQMGFDCFDSHTNFVMVDVKKPIQPYAEKFAQRGFLVGRLFPALPNHQRVTYGTMAEMQRFLPVFKEVFQG